MSAFLGPIHYWLFNKIQLQNKLVERITLLSQNTSLNLKNKLDTQYGVFPEESLEKIIDESNIHGWLQSYVSQVEYKLADSVTELLKEDPKYLEQIKAVFYEMGKEISNTISEDNASQVYKVIGDSLLDGMPCDHANILIEENEETVVWKRNTCVHADYWEEVGGSIDNYYILRDELIKGILAETSLKYEKIDEVTFSIRKEG